VIHVLGHLNCILSGWCFFWMGIL